MLAVDRDVKPRNMNFAKVEKRGGAINREGAFCNKYGKHVFPHLYVWVIFKTFKP